MKGINYRESSILQVGLIGKQISLPAILHNQNDELISWVMLQILSLES